MGGSLGETFLQANMGGSIAPTMFAFRSMCLPLGGVFACRNVSLKSSHVAMLLPCSLVEMFLPLLPCSIAPTMGGVGETFLPLLPCSNAPPMFACRSMFTWEEWDEAMLLQCSNMGGMHCYHWEEWEKHAPTMFEHGRNAFLHWEEWEQCSSHVAMLLPYSNMGAMHPATCSLVGVGETFLPCSTWEEHCSHGRSGRNIPTSEHGRNATWEVRWEKHSYKRTREVALLLPCSNVPPMFAWEKHSYKRTWEEHCYMGGVGETFLQANMGGALLHGRSVTWEECYMGGVGEKFLQANMGGALLRGRNIPTSEHGRSIVTWEEWEKHSYKRTWEEHCYMGGVGQTFLQANMGGALLHGRSGRNIPTSEHGRSIATWEEWEKHFYKRTWEEHCYMGGALLHGRCGKKVPTNEHGRSITT